MKFKVGDKVRLVRGIAGHSNGVKVGEVYEIIKIDGSFIPYKVENGEWFSEEELVLVEYTYEDLKKSPIGTKITFENKGVLVKSDKGRWENEKQIAYIKNLDGLKHIDHGKIIKIEEPTYTTVYEYKPEILDEVEKRYLKEVIRPFRNNVEIIRRMYSRTKNKDYIQIRYKNDTPTNLPYFEKDTMYKRMELDKLYTLEELGL